MNILITGGCGFIGSFLYRALGNEHNVFRLDIFSDHPTDENLSMVDLTNRNALEDYFHQHSDISLIIHTAALAHSKGTDLSFNNFKRVNFEGTKNLIDLSIEYLDLKRFIFLSTISVYGERPGINLYRENHQTKPVSPYAVTKKMAEDYLVHHDDFPYTMLRLCPVYGDNFTLNIDRRTRLGPFLYRVGRGDNRISLLNVKNLEKLVNFIIDNHREFRNEILNVADDRVYNYNELVTMQKNRTGSGTVLPIPSFLVRSALLAGRLLKNRFLVENSVKLLHDTVYDTSRLASRLKLDYSINDMYQHQ